MLDKILVNVKKPQKNIYGKIQLKSMNDRHNALALWGFEHINFESAKTVLDIGCGGGKNISNMTTLSNAVIYGVDYSKASVDMSLKLNKKAFASGRVKVFLGSAENLPFDSNYFDIVTAFETIYFWDIKKGFTEVYRILRPNGKFMITNEAKSRDGLEEIIDKIGFEVYGAEILLQELTKAGFKNIAIDEHNNGKWINIMAEKPR